MTISTLMSGLPSRSMDQATFDQAYAKLMTDLPTWGAQANALAASINAAGSGGAYSIPYTFDSTTTDADPGAGKLRLSSATQNAATALRADLLGADSTDWTTVLDTLDASTSTIKGVIRLVKQGDTSKWLTFNVTARATPTGYRNFTVANTGGSSASPFANGDALMFFFQRNGDKGDTGPMQAFPFLKVSDQKTTGTNGGTSTAAEQTRTLNTTDWNDITGASLSSNTITLPAGTYECNIRAPAGAVAGAQARLYNTSDSAYTLIGASQWISTGVNSQVDSTVSGKFTIASSKSFQVRHYTGAAVTNTGLGTPSSSGQAEVYTEAIFKKVA